jgi:hypothetical protein
MLADQRLWIGLKREGRAISPSRTPKGPISAIRTIPGKGLFASLHLAVWSRTSTDLSPQISVCPECTMRLQVLATRAQTT